MNRNIEHLLIDVGEDKYQNPTTTSFKFKTDVWNFFMPMMSYHRMNALEFGTHKGQTTRILSHLFRRVFTINKPGHFDEAMLLNADRDNIFYCGMNLYDAPIDKYITHHSFTAFFIDAGHSTDQVLMDFARSLKQKPAATVYYVFDDYGLIPSVAAAINQLIWTGSLEKVCHVGHEPGHNFGNKGASQDRILNDYEGIICKLLK